MIQMENGNGKWKNVEEESEMERNAGGDNGNLTKENTHPKCIYQL